MRNNKKRAKRIVALIASIVLVVGLLPAQALAEAADELTGQTQAVGIETVASVDPAPAIDTEKTAPDVPAEEGISSSGGNAEPRGATISAASTFTYAFDAEQEVYGLVEWDDDNNESGERPEKVTVRLMANGVELSSMEVAEGANGLWAFSFDKLPPRDPQGKEIVYSVVADEVPEYSVEVVRVGDNAFLVTYTIPTPVKPTLTITAKNQEYTYNGQIQGEGDTAYEDPAQIAEKVTVEGLLEGDELTSVVLDGQGQEVGEYPIEVTGFSINNNPGARDKYDVVLVPGTLTIKPAPVKATLTFDLGGGTIDGKTSLTIEANVGDTIKLPAAPTREGYTFKYWKGSQYAAGADYKVEGNHSFTAVWEKNATSDSGDSDKKSPLPSTGDNSAAALTPCALMALASLALLSGSVILRRRGSAYRGKHSAR